MADQPEEKGIFDAEAYLMDNGMKFLDTVSPGVARVMSNDGTEGVMNINEVLNKNGMQGWGVEFNSPETALTDRTPVSTLDRLKLSFGNKKGGVEYLKKNFQGATINAEGDLIVQKDGVWSTIDPEGISDPDGWSFSELAGDLADVAGDAVLGVGQIAGAAIAGVSTGGAGLVAGSSAGAAAASALNMAVGRVLGTYEATPQEMVTGIVLDGMLAAAGETVALGAKSYVMPAIKGMWSKVGSSSPETKDIMAAMARKGFGMSDEAAATPFHNTTAFTQTFDEIEDIASRPLESLVKGENMAGVRPGSFNAVNIATDNEMARTVLPMMQQARSNASRAFTTGVSDVGEQAARDMNPNATGEVTSAVSDLFSGMGGLIQQNKKGQSVLPLKVKSINEIRSWYNVDGPSAEAMRKSASDLLNSARRWGGGTVPKGTEAVKAIAELSRHAKDLQLAFPDTSTSASKAALEATVSTFSNQVSDGLPSSLKTGMREVNFQYAKNAGTLAEIRSLMNSQSGSWEKAALSVAKKYGNKANGDAQAQLFFDSLSSLNPSTGAASMQRLQNLNAVKSWRTVSDEGMWGTVKGVARGLTGSGIRGTNRAFNSGTVKGLRKMSYQAVKPVTYMMTQTSKMARSLDTPLINDAEKLGAALTMGMQGMAD